jgi:O-antigen/teichoic acid export membrane protein
MMSGGLVVIGLAGYGFLALSGHTLPAADAAAIASFYLVVSIVGPGVFAGLEQETSRSTSAWLAGGGALGVVARRAALAGTGLLAVVLLALGAVSPILTDRTLAGRWGLFVAIVVAVVCSAVMYLLRGVLGGTQRFTGYSVSLTTEGLSRIVLLVLVLAVGWIDPTVYAFVFATGAGFAVLAGLPWLRRRAVPPTVDVIDVTEASGPVAAGESVAGMARGLGLLVGATLGFQTVANVAPILVTARLGSDPATAAAFASAFVLVRVPVLLFAAVQAMLLPAMTRAVTAGNLPAVRATLRKIILLVAAIGLPAVLGSTVLGPWAVEFLFGAKVRLSATVLGLLAVSSVLLMLTQVLLPALVAFGRHRVVVAAWTAGGAVLAGMLVSPVHPVDAAVWGQLASCTLVVLVMAGSLVRPLRNRVAIDAVAVTT